MIHRCGRTRCNESITTTSCESLKFDTEVRRAERGGISNSFELKTEAQASTRVDTWVRENE